MTLQEIKSKYTWHELSSIPGDSKLRHSLYSPLFNNLHEQKVVYRERFIGIMKLEDITITPERFEAKAIPFLLLERGAGFDQYFFQQKHWTFGAIWSHIALSGDAIGSTYANWWIWTNPELVKAVEDHIIAKEFEKAEEILEQDK